MLVVVASLAPVGVVSVLLASARVPPGGLQVAARVGADPDVVVRGRNGELRDASQRARITDRPSRRADVVELRRRLLPVAALPAHAANAARLVADVDETSGDWR